VDRQNPEEKRRKRGDPCRGGVRCVAEHEGGELKKKVIKLRARIHVCQSFDFTRADRTQVRGLRRRGGDTGIKPNICG